MDSATELPAETPALPESGQRLASRFFCRASHKPPVSRFFSLFAITGLAIAAALATILAFQLTITPVMDLMDNERRLLDAIPEPAWWRMFVPGRWYLLYVPSAVLCSLCFGFGWMACNFVNRRNIAH